jgi:hypothetical protein
MLQEAIPGAGFSRLPPLPRPATDKGTSVDRSWEELRLPPGYELERDPDMLILRRPDGSTVATFSTRGVVPEHVEEAAREDAAREGPRAP